MSGIAMSKHTRLFLVAAATTAIALLMFPQLAPAASARDRALDRFVELEGAACVGGADIMFDMNEIDRTISEAAPHAGWVVEDLIFVGSQDEAITSVGGSVLATEGSSSWVHAQRNAPRLLKLEPRTVGKIEAFVVRETFTVC